MQEIHTKLLISRLSLVQNIFYHYIHGMKRLIIPIICMLLSLAGCGELKPLASLVFADGLPAINPELCASSCKSKSSCKAGKTLTIKGFSTNASAVYTTDR